MKWFHILNYQKFHFIDLEVDYKMKYAIGIDLGSTHSCIGVYVDGHVNILSSSTTIIPSWVTFKEDGILVGEESKNNSIKYPKNTIYDVKRIIGRKFSDTEIQHDIKTWTFDVVPDKDDNPMIKVVLGGIETLYSPEEVSSHILSYLKSMAETYLNDDIKDVVITVPAYFTDSQRNATKRAGHYAGLNVIRVINEPTAASFAYGLKSNTEECILVMDIGGCTSDISIISVDNGFFEVLGTSGLTHLGGEDFNNDISNYIKDRCLFAELTVEQELQLKSIIENAKKKLSVNDHVILNFTDLDQDITTFKLTRKKFEECCHDNFEKCMNLVKLALYEARLDESKIDRLIMVGGSTRIPYLREYLAKMFGKDIYGDINPDEAIAYGATIQAAILCGVDDDIISNIVINDVTSLSIGVETTGGLIRHIVKKNTIIPCKKSHIFTTFYDNQPKVTLKIYEGERIMAQDNHELGKFNLDGIENAKRHEPKIEVFFEINADGILKITAVNQKSNQKSELEVKYSEIKNKETDVKIQDAEENKEADLYNEKRIKMWYVHVEELNQLSIQMKYVTTEIKEEYVEDIAELISWYYDHENANVDEMMKHHDYITDLTEAITQACNL